MRPLTFSVGSPLLRVVRISVLLISLHTLHRVSIAQVTDSNLTVAITRTNQDIVLSWFGSNAISYQVESSPALTTWTNASPVFIGSNALLVVTNPIAGQARGFYRVKRLPPGDPWSVNFDPGTGILTIVANDLDNLVVEP
jgi:hypothetical protein